MPRTKQATPARKVEVNGIVDHHEEARRGKQLVQNGHSKTHVTLEAAKPSATGFLDLVICAGGIYASFLTWGYLQEKITTTSYGSAANPEVFKFSIVLNTIQSAFAAIVGYIYLIVSSRSKPRTPPVFPSSSLIAPLLLVSVTSSLASPFGYASLKHVGYITFILAKSCKLLPVMALQVSLFRRKYPLYKYAVVALVTLGVAIFTLNHPGTSKKSAKAMSADAHAGWGLFLLGVNLLFDGLTNSTQDWVNAAYAPFSGAQMMCAQNLISTALTTAYLLASPLLATTALGQAIGMAAPTPGSALLPTFLGGSVGEPAGELAQAFDFIARHPAVLKDVLGFAACGAIGQVFIFYTLARFSSLLLVTITVTRKMLTMTLSVFAFGHRLTGGQWAGVGLVFGGVAAEAVMGYLEKKRKAGVGKKRD